jgi:hypothetical protein
MDAASKVSLSTHLFSFMILGLLPLVVLASIFRDSATRFKWWWIFLIVPVWYALWILSTLALVFFVGTFGAPIAYTASFYLLLILVSKISRLRVPPYLFIIGFVIYVVLGLPIYNALAQIAYRLASLWK